MSSSKTLPRHYSGNLSKRFWATVNKLPQNEGGEAAYMLGVMLQEAEERVLRYLEERRKGMKRSTHDQAD